MSPESQDQPPKIRHLSLVPPIENGFPTKPRTDGGNPLLMTEGEAEVAYERRDLDEWDVTSPMEPARRMSDVIADPGSIPSVTFTEEEFIAGGGTPETVLGHPHNPDTIQ